jgi:hypothetical protein
MNLDFEKSTNAKERMDSKADGLGITDGGSMKSVISSLCGVFLKGPFYGIQ